MLPLQKAVADTDLKIPSRKSITQLHVSGWCPVTFPSAKPVEIHDINKNKKI